MQISPVPGEKRHTRLTFSEKISPDQKFSRVDAVESEQPKQAETGSTDNDDGLSKVATLLSKAMDRIADLEGKLSEAAAGHNRETLTTGSTAAMTPTARRSLQPALEAAQTSMESSTSKVAGDGEQAKAGETPDGEAESPDTPDKPVTESDMLRFPNGFAS